MQAAVDLSVIIYCQPKGERALTLMPMRKLPAWRISNTLEADIRMHALNAAMAGYGVPETMNTDQGSQVTSFAWTDRPRRSRRAPLDGWQGMLLHDICVERLPEVSEIRMPLSARLGNWFRNPRRDRQMG